MEIWEQWERLEFRFKTMFEPARYNAPPSVHSDTLMLAGISWLHSCTDKHVDLVSQLHDKLDFLNHLQILILFKFTIK